MTETITRARRAAAEFVRLNPGRFPKGLDVSTLPIEDGVCVIPLPATEEEGRLEALVSGRAFLFGSPSHRRAR